MDYSNWASFCKRNMSHPEGDIPLNGIFKTMKVKGCCFHPKIPILISFFQSCTTRIVFISPGENLNRIRWANAIESSPGCSFIHLYFLFSLYFYFPDSREKVATSSYHFPYDFLFMILSIWPLPIHRGPSTVTHHADTFNRKEQTIHVKTGLFTSLVYNPAERSIFEWKTLPRMAHVALPHDLSRCWRIKSI